MGLNEAIKAAANQKQSNRNSLSPTIPNEAKTDLSDDIGSFKFPPSAGDQGDNSGQSSSSHNHSRSLAYGQQSFKFPPTPDQSNDTRGNSLLPPNPNFSVTQSPDRGHNRRSSHFRTGSRGSGSNTNTDGINSNWRAQQQSPQQQQRQGGLLNHLKSGSPWP